MQILLVDNPRHPDRMAALVRAGHQVKSVASAKAAVQELAAGGHRMVIADLPEGAAMCRTIRSGIGPGSVYVLLIGQHAQDRARAMNCGANDYLCGADGQADLAARVEAAHWQFDLDARELAIFTLAKIVEQRDPTVGRHLERVRLYSRLLAQDLLSVPEFKGQMSDRLVRTICLAAALHDIGKARIPDAVLLKAGTLDPQEQRILKSHTTLGAQALREAQQQYPEAEFFETAIQVALTHHERFDASGYPQGLGGEQIPLAGRIVALADSYDELTTRRSLMGPFDHAAARSVMMQRSGTQFDPHVVDAFVRIETRILEVAVSYSDKLQAAA